MEYKKTVKKYKNAKSIPNTTQHKSKQHNRDNKVVANSKKQENKTANEVKTLSHEGEPQPRANSNLKETQNQDTLAKNNTINRIIYCIIASIITIIAILLLDKNIFNTKLESNKDVFLLPKYAGITLFFAYFVLNTIAICMISRSNKTDNTAYNTNIILFSIAEILAFVATIFLYICNLYIPACILLLILTIISIYLTYRYYVSCLTSGILQTICTLVLLYGLYITLAFSLINVR